MNSIQASREYMLTMKQLDLQSIQQQAAWLQLEKDQSILSHLPKLGRLPGVLKECTWNLLGSGIFMAAGIHLLVRPNIENCRQYCGNAYWECNRNNDTLIAGTLAASLAAGLYSLVQTYRHTPTLPVFAANVVRAQKEAEAKTCHPRGSAERVHAYRNIATLYNDCIKNINLSYSVKDKEEQRKGINSALYIFKATETLPIQSVSNQLPQGIEAFLQKLSADLEPKDNDSFGKQAEPIEQQENKSDKTNTQPNDPVSLQDGSSNDAALAFDIQNDQQA